MAFRPPPTSTSINNLVFPLMLSYASTVPSSIFVVIRHYLFYFNNMSYPVTLSSVLILCKIVWFILFDSRLPHYLLYQSSLFQPHVHSSSSSYPHDKSLDTVLLSFSKVYVLRQHSRILNIYNFNISCLNL